jgi:hypothetical protein
MVHHIVLFKLLDFATEEEKKKAANRVKQKLLELKSRIPVIVDWEIGVNFKINHSDYDVVINSTFRSEEDLEVYRVHPDHQAFIEFNKNYSKSKSVIDYKTE